MTIKEKSIYIILSILTLGIYPFIIMKNKKNKESNILSSANKVTVNIEKLIEFLGGKNNITGTEFTHIKVKFFIQDKSIVKIEEIKNLKSVSGVVVSSNRVIIIVGNQAKQ